MYKNEVNGERFKLIWSKYYLRPTYFSNITVYTYALDSEYGINRKFSITVNMLSGMLFSLHAHTHTHTHTHTHARDEYSICGLKNLQL